MQISRETRAFLLLTLVTVVWAGLMPTGKIALRGVPPLTIAAIRLVIGSLLLSIFLARESRPVPWSPKLVGALFFLGFAGYCGSVGCTYYGLRLTTVTNAALLNAAAPVSLALLSMALLGERPSSRALVGIGLSVIGVVVIITRGSWDVVQQSQYNLGDLILLGTQLSWGTYTIYGRRLMNTVSPLAATTYTYMTGAFWVLIGCIVLEHDQWNFAEVSWASWLSIAYQSTLGTFAHFWFYDAIAVIGPSRASIFLNLVPVMAIGIAYLFLDEPLLPSHLVGGAIVMIGILSATRR